MTSKHYEEFRKDRALAIAYIGEGKVIHSTVMEDLKRGKSYQYDITDKAILIVRATDDPDYIITKYPARPSRIHRYWADAPKWLIKLSVKHTREGLVF